MLVSSIYPTVTRAWAHQVRRSPHRTALVSQDEQLTYAELDHRAERISRWLVDEGAGPEMVIANRLPRSIAALTVQLAVLKAGAVHVAIPPCEPAERAAAILRDADPAVVLDVALVPKPPRTRPVMSLPEDAAYIVYPPSCDDTVRGVVVEHRNLANLLEEHYHSLFRWAVVACGMGPLRVGHSVSLAADDSWGQLLWMLSGHELSLVPDEALTTAPKLAGFLETARLDVLVLDIVMLESLLATGILHTRRAPGLVLVRGGVIGPELWGELRSIGKTTVVNLYGPNECTVFCAKAVVNGYRTPILGTPVANTKATVVDESDASVPLGAIGELVVSGAAVARGYRGSAEGTTSRFTASQHGYPGRRYRTGDLVRWLPNGTLQYRGRVDGVRPVTAWR